MEDKIMNADVLSHPDGVEVKLSTKSINIRGLIYFFVLLILGSALFIYIWDDFSSFNLGFQIVHVMGKSGFSSYIILYFIAYIFLQTAVLYMLGGKSMKSLRWHFSWAGAGFYLARPIALKYYRVCLLLPAILLGLLPSIHGFCTGSASVFYLGLYGLVFASADITFWNKLRPFDDEDLLQAGKEAFQATIIKRNYGKNN